MSCQSKKEGKDQESIQSSTTPDSGCHILDCVIKHTYGDQTVLKVKAHSTRAIGPSRLFLRVASLKSVFEAADWSSEVAVNIFQKFYY